MLTFGSGYALISIIYLALSGNFSAGTVTESVIGAIVFGLLFTLAMTFIVRKLDKTIQVGVGPDETVIKEGGANHFKKGEGVGGKLVLTDRRLIFKSHKYNIQNHEVSFDLGQLSEVRASEMLKFLHNGLTVKLINRGEEKFIVDEPQEWITSITKQKLQF